VVVMRNQVSRGEPGRTGWAAVVFCSLASLVVVWSIGAFAIMSELRVLRDGGIQVKIDFITRLAGWWAIAGAIAALLTSIICWVLELRHRNLGLSLRVLTSIGLVGSVLGSGYVLGMYVESTRAVEQAECIIP